MGLPEWMETKPKAPRERADTPKLKEAQTAVAEYNTVVAEERALKTRREELGRAIGSHSRGMTPGALRQELEKTAKAMGRTHASIEAITQALTVDNVKKGETPLAVYIVKQIAEAAFQQTVAAPARSLVVVRMDTVKAKPVSWLWPGRFPRGMLSLIAGAPGAAKSSITVDMAARITRGGEWPGGGTADKGDVEFLASEDTLEYTVRPRLDAMGADPTRVHYITAAEDGAGARMVSLADDLDLIKAELTRTGASLLVVDPVNAYLGNRQDGFKDAEIRRVLTPLGQLAEELRVAVVGIMHTKKAREAVLLYTIGGSVAFPAAARSVFFVAKDKEDADRRLMAHAKLSVDREAPTLAFAFAEKEKGSFASSLVWEKEPVNATADDVMTERPERDTKTGRAAEWLEKYLTKHGKATRAALDVAAEKAGIAPRTLERARGELWINVEQVRAKKKDKKGRKRGTVVTGWTWELRGTEQGL